MARRTQIATVVVVATIVGIAVAAVVLRSGLRCAGFAGPEVTAEELPPPCPPDRLRIATWNLRNFPFDERSDDPAVGFLRQTNICDLETALAGLDAGILGLSEIRDARRFPPLLRRAGRERAYQLVQSRHGGRHGQRLAIAWDDRMLEASGPPVELRELVLDDGLRPGLALRLRSRRDPHLELTVVQVHLRSTPGGYGTRMDQHRALVGWLSRELAEGRSDRIVLMGDFNTTGSRGGSVERELAVVDRLYAPIGLRRLANASGCTEYWEGTGEPDGLQLPSLLDHVWLRGLDGSSAVASSWLHCQRHACEPFVSRAGQEDGTFWDVSDHCPVLVDLPWPPAPIED